MTLYEQLLHGWERGYFALIKDEDGDFYLSTTHDKQCKTFAISEDAEGGESSALRTTTFESRDDDNIDSSEEDYGWELVRFVHPSELMGGSWKKGDKFCDEDGDVQTCQRVTDDGNLIEDEEGDEYYPSDITPCTAGSKEVKEAIKLLEKNGVIKNGKIIVK